MKTYIFTLTVKREDHTESSDVLVSVEAENFNDALLGLEKNVIENKLQWFYIDRIRIEKK